MTNYEKMYEKFLAEQEILMDIKTDEREAKWKWATNLRLVSYYDKKETKISSIMMHGDRIRYSRNYGISDGMGHDGPYVKFDKKGKISERGTLIQDPRYIHDEDRWDTDVNIGIHEKFLNGKLLIRETYNEKGILEGPYLEFDEAGNVVKEGRYHEGKFIKKRSPQLRRNPASKGMVFQALAKRREGR